MVNLNFVQTTVFSEKFRSFSIVNFRGFFLAFKVSKVNLNSIFDNVGFPKLMPFIPRHSFKSRRLFNYFSAIKLVLGWCTDSKIRLSVIKFVPVFMIGMKTFWGLHYQSVKKNLLSISKISSNIIIPNTIKPMEMLYSFIILSIYNCYKSVLKVNFHAFNYIAWSKNVN